MDRHLYNAVKRMEKESGCWKKRFTYSYKEREEDKGGIYAFKVKVNKKVNKQRRRR